MKGRSLRALAVALCLMVFVGFAPGAASALLLGDKIDVTLVTLPLPGSTILSGNDVEVVAGAEFSAIPFTDGSETSLWRLDISDTGFTLGFTCTSIPTVECTFDGLPDISSTLPFDSASVTPGPPSSVVIDFQAFEVETSGEDPTTREFSATFTVRAPTAPVPVPGSFLLMLVGGLALGAFLVHRRLG
jgi:hypothetical protein